MAQILSVYGIVAAVIIANALKEKMALYTGFMQFGAGLAVGLCGMAAGFAIGIVGDSGGKADSPMSIFPLFSVFANARYSIVNQFEPVLSSRACTSDLS